MLAAGPAGAALDRSGDLLCIVRGLCFSGVPALSARLTITELHAGARQAGGNPVDGTTEGSVATSRPAATGRPLVSGWLRPGRRARRGQG